ncbi:hypothetical protein EGW08_013924 [Elysia chlorotica]|uniref:Uncharacterized protein n=1 Tax=Elysia chlorotica TaxID=188477 RepID=A0A433T9W5_ELYCH|nr:hypothetical protein EGW08_013924 [Elysia chlorotica]
MFSHSIENVSQLKQSIPLSSLKNKKTCIYKSKYFSMFLMTTKCSDTCIYKSKYFSMFLMTTKFHKSYAAFQENVKNECNRSKRWLSSRLNPSYLSFTKQIFSIFLLLLCHIAP